MKPLVSKYGGPIESTGDFSTESEFVTWIQKVHAEEQKAFCYLSDQLFDDMVKKTAMSGATQVRCSKDEIRQMNEAMGMEVHTWEKVIFWNHVICSCSRQLNVFDVFQKGIKSHGKKFMNWASTGRKKVVGVPDGMQMWITCSDCGVENEAAIEYTTDTMRYNYTDLPAAPA